MQIFTHDMYDCRMVREDENTWGGSLGCRRVYVRRVAEDELKHWTTDGWFTLTRYWTGFQRLNTEILFFSGLTDVATDPPARQLNYCMSICDQLT